VLSPGKYHEKVPRDLADNLGYRVRLLKALRADRRVHRGIVEMCRRDILFYILSFVWCHNPKLPPETCDQPFIPWDFQEKMIAEILDCVERQKPGVCEKSREMGASWLFLIVEDYLARFHRRRRVLNISRDADSVDCKSPDSLFWKLRFINNYLPDFLPQVTDLSKMFIELESGSTITGEASTGYAGVSGRATMILLDEFSKVKDDTAMRQATAGTADCRFFVSTHEGEGTEFYRICQEAEFVKWTLHWTRHPMKNKGLYSYEREPEDGKPPGLRFWDYDPNNGRIIARLRTDPCIPEDYQFVTDGSPTGGPHPGVRSPWYDSMCSRIGDSRAVAMELDIDPVSSVKTLFEPIVIRELQRGCAPPYWEGDIHYEKDGTNPRLVPGRNGPLKLWLHLVGQGVPPPAVFKVGADVSGGTGCTPSCLSIGDAGRSRKVGEYANPRIDPKEFGTLVCAVGNLFVDVNGAQAEVCWEDRGPGVTCGKQIRDLGYPKRYREVNFAAVGKKFAMKDGYQPERDGKATMLRDYKYALTQRLFYNPSKIALEETLKFKYDPQGKIVHTGAMDSPDPSGARENHGDRASADGMVWLMMKENALKKDETPEEEAKKPFWHQTLQGRRDMAERRERELERWA
jgi:hypothetical protein